ncbi:Do/DeqQ family serine protease [Alkalispirochaeta americana]|uniref:Do/DeqQ family serine protease n=1 Tax=Alkalispirochaeta americana TaxID=159291 RepID=A0A1N6P3X2_9SPIO|nr:Do family serine endopeptidase [Alkalispirochaeta americana]SIP99071.1 Do/DeqQ family serine protease [Alkalispirochaeta americana]
MKIHISPRRLFVANLLLTGLLLGLILGAVLFSCSTNGNRGGVIAARDRDRLAQADPQALQESFRLVARVASPSVVRIDVEEVRTRAMPQGDDAPWFDFFFGDPYLEEESHDQEGERSFRTQGIGSGVVVRRQGDLYYVLTNEHVVGQADQIIITTTDDEEYTARIVGTDTRKDLALLSFTASREIPLASLGDSDTLQVGDWVLAIGSPFGFQSTVTAGIVSAVNRRGGPIGNISDFIQTDAAINRGNSGGALVNLRGEVVGINTWITSQTGGSMGLGFSIPINNVVRAIDDFIEIGAVRYGWLGVSIRSVTAQVAESLALPNRRGALVHHVFRDSPAQKGGLLPGDFVVALNGVPIGDSDQLVLEVGELPVGEAASFSVIRYGEALGLDVLIAERESDQEIAELNRRLWPGFSVYPLTEEVRSDLDLSSETRGLLVSTVERRTPAAAGGLRVGDILLGINGRETTSMVDFYRAINEGGREVTLSLLRDDKTVEIGIQQ